MESSYNQNKKMRPSQVELDVLLSRTNSVLDYATLLDGWSACFGEENIVVTPFERSNFGDGLERYFLSLLGVEWSQSYKTELKNPGLNRDCLAFVSEYFLPEEVGSRERGRVIEMLAQYSSEHSDDKSLKYNLPPAKRLEIIEKYSAINREVAQRYLGREDGRLFLDPSPSLDDEWQPYSGLSDERQDEIIRYLVGRGIRVKSHSESASGTAERVVSNGKTLYLHIGLHKTGTSYLQSFLAANGERLLDADLLVPGFDGRSAHHLFASVCFDGNDEAKRFPLQLRGQFSERSEWVTAMEAERDSLLESGADKIVMSSERFSNNDPERLSTFFAGFDVKIVVFLRRQDRLLEARVNQLKKVGRLTDERMARLFERADRNYYRILSKWSRVFGKDNVIVQPYERSHFGDGLESRFLDLIGVKWSDEIEPVESINRSLSRDCLAFLEKHSQQVVPTKALRRILEEYTGAHPDEVAIRDHFSPSDHFAILNGCRESNAMVAREYLGRDDGVLFYEQDPDPAAPWIQYSGLSDEAEARLISYIREAGYVLPDYLGYGESGVEDRLVESSHG